MTAFATLEDAILADVFPDVDLALRRGRHIDRDDVAWYAFLLDAQERLETFYSRFGCDLVHKSDGYFYLLPTNDQLGRRHLSAGEMLVGQALTLLYLDPSTAANGGLVTREQVLGQLAAVMGTDTLLTAFTGPKRKRFDERVAQETARSKVSEALRRLATLGFVEITEPNVLLRPSLMRFAEPVRGAAAPEAALERLAAAGELVLVDPDDSEGLEVDDAGVKSEGDVVADEGGETTRDDDGLSAEKPG